MRQFSMTLIALVAFMQIAPLAVQAEETVQAQSTPQTLPAITVVQVQKRMLRDSVLVSGLIAPVEQVQVAPLVEGQPIEALLADVGDMVTAGQVLARLSTTTLTLQKAQLTASRASALAMIAQSEAQLIDAQSSADEALRVSARTKALFDQGNSSQAALDKANAGSVSATSRLAIATQSLEASRANLALSDAQLSNLDLQLSRTEVKAPVAGEITDRNAQIGAIASAAGPAMFTMIRGAELELQADVAEGDMQRLAPGQEVTLIVASSTDPLKGTVRLIEPTIDAVSRQGRIRIAVNPNHIIRSGMFAQAEVLISNREVLALPATAIGQEQNNAHTMQITDGRAKMIQITIGVRDNGWVEVTSGINLDDTVVAKAGAFVRDGDQVNPIPMSAETN